LKDGDGSGRGPGCRIGGNLPVNEPDFGRVRVTTTLMLGPRAGVAPTPEPAAARVRTNLHALRQVLQRSHAGEIRSAEDGVDAAEACVARTPEPGRRTALLSATRLLRRIDQAVVGVVGSANVGDQRTR
jgi:hypothetical protein